MKGQQDAREVKRYLPEWVMPALYQHLSMLGCKCVTPLLGYSPGFGPRCRLCNVDAQDVLQEATSRQQALREFARKILAGYLGQGDEIGDIDGGDVQGWAEQCGLLEAVNVTEPCGEFCGCAEVDAFPLLCYRPTALLQGTEEPKP